MLSFMELAQTNFTIQSGLYTALPSPVGRAHPAQPARCLPPLLVRRRYCGRWTSRKLIDDIWELLDDLESIFLRLAAYGQMVEVEVEDGDAPRL